ncbi:hypothetical protein LCGC14_1161150 [marine sediment metagenome]|uniref:Uncharacterized protein n=1 Tax=marine sediment metagenome TaxID=412755 RepID=A0A0F9PAW9_9ZZZZ
MNIMGRKEIQRKYDVSEKGIARRKKHAFSKKGALVQRRYDASKKRKMDKRKAYLLLVLNSPEKIKARSLARKLPIKPCSVKGCKKVGHKHHEDYLKPLDVIYFCNRHHQQIHHE